METSVSGLNINILVTMSYCSLTKRYYWGRLSREYTWSHNISYQYMWIYSHLKIKSLFERREKAS